MLQTVVGVALVRRYHCPRTRAVLTAFKAYRSAAIYLIGYIAADLVSKGLAASRLVSYGSSPSKFIQHSQDPISLLIKLPESKLGNLAKSYVTPSSPAPYGSGVPFSAAALY